MEPHLSIERMNQRDCCNADLLRCCTVKSDKTMSHLGDFGSEGETKGATLCPITPIPCRKNGESVLVMSTPLSLESPPSSIVQSLDSTSSDEVVGLGCEDSPRTPEEGVFNPFAPGPEELCRAPLCKKTLKGTRRIVARRLDFDDVDEPHSLGEDDNVVEIRLEKILMETVYETILDAIILKQSEDLELDGCSTPTSPLPLSGISETCPAAPTKLTERKSLKIDPGLCRKLEF
ncbi:uncharacterized protein LOC141600646 [Silene latifolia]|uniref:uncharacterized protein LOC141600646 n=1 Tax=Silene latifolia TaxID=37657 RepID=UPI003D77F1EB